LSFQIHRQGGGGAAGLWFIEGDASGTALANTLRIPGAGGVNPGQFEANTFSIPGSAIVSDGTIIIRAQVGWASGTGPSGHIINWSSFSQSATINVSTFAPLAPTNLQPSTVQNRLEPIVLLWSHAPNPGVNDPQIGSQVEYWQGTGARVTASGGTANTITIPAGIFTSEAAVNFRARTQGGNNAGWGPWSNQANFPLQTINPPQAPLSLTPITRQNPTRQIRLEWTHNPAASGAQDSQDGSEVEYWQDTGPRTAMEGEFGNRFTIMADTFRTVEPVNFRARTHGLRGGWGPWSAVVNFPLGLDPPLAPTSLAPSVPQDRWRTIALSWRHTPNPADWDTQSDSQVEFWQSESDITVAYVGTINRAELPEFTFPDSTSVKFRARTQTARNGWGEWSEVHEFELSLLSPLPPSNPRPTTPQNPWGQIHVSWLYVPNPEMRPVDEQIDSEVRLRQGDGDWAIFNGGAENQTIIPSNLFSDLESVEFQARTRAEIHGWGEWSESAFFELRETPPMPPTLTHPVNIPIRATDGIFLQWSYNSPFDIFPSRFDIRYRIGGSEWIEMQNDSIGGFPASLTARTRAESNQNQLEWQVRAWGELGNVGPWSEIAQAFIIGIPPTPVIVRATNSGRPEIHFSARDAMAWELEMLHHGQVIYTTGERAFTGFYIHTAERFFENGNYLIRLRIANEYSIYSEWATLAFTIAVTPPESIDLRSANNLEYHTRLWFNGIGRTGYIYRAEIVNDDFTKQGNFVRIARVENVDNFIDWTTRPGLRYKYFVRAINKDFGFTDSTTETAKADFMHTTIATVDMPHDMVKMLEQLGGKPTKDSNFQQEKTLTKVEGRESPIVQMGTHKDRTASLAFYVTLTDRDRLVALAGSKSVLILRDWRLGVIYGTITGGIRAQSDGFSEHCQVSFGFTETDYAVEIDII